MQLLQVQLVFAHGTKLLIAKGAMHRILQLAETLVTVQTGLLAEHLVALLAGVCLSRGHQNLRGSVHPGVVFSGRPLILEDPVTGRAVCLHVAVHFWLIKKIS